MIYLNNASMGQPTEATRARIADHTALDRRLGPVAAKSKVAPELAHLSGLAATFLGASKTADRIGYEATTTAAWLAIMLTLDLRGKTVLVAPEEWGANIRVLQRLMAMTGGRLVALPPLSGPGAASLDAWAAYLTADVAALVLPMVSSVQGTLYPVAQIGALARPRGCKIIVDAAQALGQVPIHLDGMGVDALIGTCRKWLRGPRGTTVYWTAPSMGDLCRPATLTPSEVNTSLLLGLGSALDQANRIGTARLRDQIMANSLTLWEAAQGLGLSTLSGAAPQTGTVCLAIPTARQHDVASALAHAGVMAKFPNSAVDEPFSPPPPKGFVPLRLAPHVDTEKAAIDTAIAALRSAL